MKKNKNTIYKTLRQLAMLYFKIRYGGQTVGDAQIPKEGPILICGNHIHSHDQFMPLRHTKRVVHYLAKKEYFDSKFAFFFRWAGCICVDRIAHDGKAISEAVEVLNQGGAVGLFPEGTRNTLYSKKDKIEEVYPYFKEDFTKEEFIDAAKELKVKTSQINLLLELKNNNKISEKEFKEYFYNVDESLKELIKRNVITEEEYKNSLLLPFKFGAVSMAQKTNATIITYAIYGDYKKSKKNLKIKFGEAFKVGDMPLEEANKKLFNIIRNLYIELKEEHEKENK